MLEACTSNNEHVEQVPMLGSRVAPWHSVLWLHLEIGIGQTEAMKRAKL